MFILPLLLPRVTSGLPTAMANRFHRGLAVFLGLSATTIAEKLVIIEEGVTQTFETRLDRSLVDVQPFSLGGA